MTDNTSHIDLDSDEFDGTPKALRDYVKQLQKRDADRQAELDATRGQLTQFAIGNVLADKGFANPKRVQAAILADGVNVLDQSAMDAWLAENGNDFARAGATPATPQEQDHSAEAQAFSHLEVPGATPSGGKNRADEVIAQITPDMTPEQVRQKFLAAGI